MGDPRQVETFCRWTDTTRRSFPGADPDRNPGASGCRVPRRSHSARGTGRSDRPVPEQDAGVGRECRAQCFRGPSGSTAPACAVLQRTGLGRYQVDLAAPDFRHRVKRVLSGCRPSMMGPYRSSASTPIDPPIIHSACQNIGGGRRPGLDLPLPDHVKSPADTEIRSLGDALGGPGSSDKWRPERCSTDQDLVVWCAGQEKELLRLAEADGVDHLR